MKVKVNQNQLNRILGKFLTKETGNQDDGLFIRMMKILRIIGQDEEIGKYLIREIGKGNIRHYKNNDAGLGGFEINFTINSLPMTLYGERIFFNRGGRDFDFELVSPFVGEDDRLDLSYSVLNKLHKSLIKYESRKLVGNN